ncbi:Sortase family protein [Propionibacterium cyclohexanicum]|uniref:Sortase family protein n=1 Tax=Propionibacterium cyclohexanicum TaxID=64702 RepID=A0A1H9PK71_9ACTN|nr:class F sortase [Propionibacterium cyclohexanicum]SER48608.1 Sortase family protein [Propionibacterium cyclohexanicum]
MRRFVRAVATLILIAALGFVAWQVHAMLPSSYEKQLPLYTPGASPAAPQAAAQLSSAAGCEADPHPLVGSRITIDGRTPAMPMLQLGLAADGSPATPPGNDSHTVAWYDQGPAVGSATGHVILTAHTFRYGGALGNELNNGLLHEGDIIRISDGTGHTVCYRFSHALKVLVQDYDPRSDVLYSQTGAPQLVLVVCADYPLTGGEPKARALYYADLVRSA